MSTAMRNGLSPIRLVAVIEATTVTGPAKNLIEFCQLAREPDWSEEELPAVEPRLVTFQREGVTTNRFVEVAQGAGIPVEVISEVCRFDRTAVSALKAVVKAREPRILQTHGVKSHFLVRLSGLARNIPWVAFHHGYTRPDLRMRVYNQLDRWSLRGATRVVTMNRAFAEELARIGVGRDRIEVVHNSVDADRFEALRERKPDQIKRLRIGLGLPAAERVVLVVGRLSREKGLVEMLQAFDRLRRVHSATLVIVGDGPDRLRLERAVRLKGLTGTVVFAGHVADVTPYYAVADVLALPSRSEGSPNVLLEAMAARLPVVATAAGGVPEIVADEVNGLLVSPRDPIAMADALSRVLEGPELAEELSAKGLATVRLRHSPQNRARRLAEMYRDLAFDAADARATHHLGRTGAIQLWN